METPSGESRAVNSGDAEFAEHEAALWKSFKSEELQSTREKLFGLYAGFAENVAWRIWQESVRGDIDFGDLRQFAYAGLLEALDRFDQDLGTPFRAYAVHRIAGCVRDGLAHMNEVREQISWRQRMRRERLKSLSDGHTRQQAPVEKLADLAVGLALGFMLEGTGIVGAPGHEPISTDTNAYDTLAWKETLDRLHRELDRLPERQATILRQHYINGMDFEGLSALLSISKGRVSQLHREALSTLRKRLHDHNHFRMIR
jgi:RNA polymerase sigma factor FliA